MYDEVADLIRSVRVAFPRFGNGVSQQSIENAECELGFPLPISFKWWLLNYGGGQIKGDIMYGLEDGDEGRPDIVQLARTNESDGLYETDRLVFCIGNSENFYFDTTVLDNSGEYRVFQHEIGSDEQYLYAESFLSFLDRRIREMYR